MNFIPIVVEDEKPGQIRCESEAVGTVSLPLQVSQSLRGKSLTLGLGRNMRDLFPCHWFAYPVS